MKAGDATLLCLAAYYAMRRLGKRHIVALAATWLLYKTRQHLNTANHRHMARGKTAVVIGAGAGGVVIGRQLEELGVEYVVLEKGDGVGGCWRVNSYPGCEADVVAALYSFSFGDNSKWRRKWASRGEVLAYITQCYEDSKVRDHVIFNTEVTTATWNSETSQWCVTTSTGREFTCDYLISACGMLRDVAMPSFPTSEFTGKTLHTAGWDHTYDYSNKKISVVGTGSSGVQAICELAKIPGVELTVYMRSAPWVGDKSNSSQKFVHGYFPSTIGWAMRVGYFVFFELLYFVAFDLTTPKNLKTFARNTFEKKMRGKLAELDASQTLVEKLIPQYPVGCKRVCLHSDWLRTMTTSNVNVITEKIHRLTPKGVATEGGEHQADVVIFATGFKKTNFLHPVKVVGDHGVTLDEAWERESDTGRVAPVSYLGVSVPGFPNLFFLNGPATNGFNSIFFSLECQAALIHSVISTGAKTAQPTQLATDTYTTRITTGIDQTIFTHPQCGSPENVLNKKRIPNSWYGPMTGYWLSTRAVNLSDWHLTY